MKRGFFKVLNFVIVLTISWLNQIDVSFGQSSRSIQCINGPLSTIGDWSRRCASTGGGVLASVDLRYGNTLTTIRNFFQNPRNPSSCWIGLIYQPASGPSWIRRWVDGTTFSPFQIRSNVKFDIFV